jgi:N-methylhydantoinase B/oxoprolinase/acetone carboxylase alpha subunit
MDKSYHILHIYAEYGKKICSNMQKNMQEYARKMQKNKQKNMQKYARKYASKQTICRCHIITYFAYFAYSNMQNMQNMDSALFFCIFICIL